MQKSDGSLRSAASTATKSTRDESTSNATVEGYAHFMLQEDIYLIFVKYNSKSYYLPFCSRSDGNNPPQLILVSGAAVIPHPAKQDKGGEDAYFACDRGMCIGVADGVGGWAEIGVDPGLYSRELMLFAKKAADNGSHGKVALLVCWLE